MVQSELEVDCLIDRWNVPARIKRRHRVSGFRRPWEYDVFAEAVLSQRRFLHTPAVKAFLDAVDRGSMTREIVMPAGKVFSRAQTGCREMSRQDKTGRRWMEELPYLPERMIPPSRNVREGRINPRGIAYLYLATDDKTAISEVRPSVGMSVTVAKFRTKKQMTLVDLARETRREGLPRTGLMWFSSVMQRKGKISQEDIDQSVWAQIDLAFSKPADPNDEYLNYVPTQIIAELLVERNYDGIIYRSGLNPKEYNVALFDVNSAEFVSAQLFAVDRIDYDFSESGKTWFLKNEEYASIEITKVCS